MKKFLCLTSIIRLVKSHSFGDSGDGPVALEAVECMSANAAIMRAEALARKPEYTGAVAFSRTGDPGAGEFSDAVVLRTFGEIGVLL